MPSGSGPIRLSRVSQIIHVFSILLVLSNILFDALDLDGSNFPRLLAPVKRIATVAVVPSETQISYSFERSELRDAFTLPVTDCSRLDVRPSRAEGLSSSALGTARYHGYRVGLARNSLPDSSPYL
jgi:hypothetical protein